MRGRREKSADVFISLPVLLSLGHSGTKVKVMPVAQEQKSHRVKDFENLGYCHWDLYVFRLVIKAYVFVVKWIRVGYSYRNTSLFYSSR